jgi:L-asparaginase II
MAAPTSETTRETRPDDTDVQPVQLRVWRGAHVESEHRGVWVVADTDGRVVDHGGTPGYPVWARSTVKALQVLPLLETGGADACELRDSELALACASHNAEPQHTERVRRLLERIDLDVDHLLCGKQPPGDPDVRRALRAAGGEPTALHNNCSGKHAGFLALSRHLGAATADYLDPEGLVQSRVRAAVAEMCSTPVEQIPLATDGCSAPTFRLPLDRMATAFARVANPEGLAPDRARACERILAAVARYPELIAGRYKRICTDLVRASGGRLFAKVGAEGVYVIGVRGAGVGLAVKLADGQGRGLFPLVVDLCERFGWLAGDALDELFRWRAGDLTNWSGRTVGRVEVLR